MNGTKNNLLKQINIFGHTIYKKINCEIKNFYKTK